MLSIWARKATTPTPIPNAPVRTVPITACNWLANWSPVGSICGRVRITSLGFSFNEADQAGVHLRQAADKRSALVDQRRDHQHE